MIAQALETVGVCFSIGDLRFRVRCDQPELAAPFANLYQDYRLQPGLPDGWVCDFDTAITRKSHVGTAGEVEFRWGGNAPLPALPVSQTHPLFEWGLNWCIATLCGTDIVIHAAIVERNGVGLVLPGEPGAGKSTLCAALALSGWRLFSDELTVISIGSGLAIPIPRPISLKDESITVISSRFPEAQLTEPISETRKGQIAYVRPPSAAVRNSNVFAPIRYFLFPRFQKDSELVVSSLPKSACMARLMDSTFNVGLLGHEGFSVLANIIATSDGYELSYGKLDQALEWINRHCI